MENNFIIAQILGFIGLVIEILVFQFKGRRLILFLLMIGSIFWGLHFYFLQEFVSSGILFWSVLRLLVANIIKEKTYLFTFSKYFFVLSMFFITFYFYKTYVDIIALFAGITGVISSFQEKEKYLRILAIISTFLRLIISILVVTPISIIASFVFLTSSIIGYIRFYKK